MSVCVSVCLPVRDDISGTTHAIVTKFLWVLLMSVARSPATLTIGCIAYWWQGGDGSAQCRRCVIYDCLALVVYWL